MESQRESKISFFSANLLYMTVMLLFVTLGYIVQNRSFKYGILITEFMLIALPTVIFTRARGASVKEELRLNPLSPVDALLIVIAFVSAYFAAAFINLLGQILISTLGKLIVPDIPFAKGFREYVELLFVIAASAGICEEILFRGFILRAYEKLGMWPSVIIAAVLFSALHLNIQNILAPFFLGIILGFAVIKTNSILAGILGHFINNAISVTWGFLIMNIPFFEYVEIDRIQSGMTTESLLGTAALFGIVLPFACAVMVMCLKAISDRHPEPAAGGAELSLSGALKNIRQSWPLLVSLLIFAVMMAVEVLYIISGEPLINNSKGMMKMLDVAVIGGGPAALSAALNLKIRNKSFVLLGGNEKVTGLMKAPRIDNYPGMKGISGSDLLQSFRDHVISMGVDIRKEKAYSILDIGGYFSINAGNEFYEARSVIIATGHGKAKYLEGEREYLGKGVGYCATCDGPLYRNKSVAVISENAEGEEEANFLSEICQEVYYLPAYAEKPRLKGNIKVLNEKVVEILGDGSKVRSLATDRRELKVDAVFIIRKVIPADRLLEGLELHEGSIKVDRDMSTSVKGVFACGDCTGKPYQVAKAVGEGNIASLSAVRYLESIDNKRKF